MQRLIEPLVYTARFVRTVLPQADRELARWEEAARAIPEPALRQQALASLTAKRFHAQGGCVFAAAYPEAAGEIVPLIVALQNISDYLDNLVDRTASLNERDFRCLHQAMLDAVSSHPVRHPYYAYHLHRNDGGYLDALVAECQRRVARLGHYHLVEAEVKRQLQRYNDLQVYKHLPHGERVGRLIAWHQGHPDRPDGLTWWEFAAACGSTLGVFALFVEAARGTDKDRVARLAEVYFPWLCGVHILLDYFIDQDEDRREGDLNFVSFYPSEAEALAGMRALVLRAREAIAGLPDAPFHTAVLEGLLGLYLTDAKVAAQGLQAFARSLLAAGSLRARLVFASCRRWRRRHAGRDTAAPGRR